MKAIRGLPDVTIELKGSVLSAADLESLESVRVHQRLSMPTQCEFVLVDPPASFAAGGIQPGASLRVRFGGSTDPLFVGQVTAVEFSHGASKAQEVRIRGYDHLHSLRKRQPVRAHVQVSVADLARELTGDLGISVEAAQPGPLWRHIIQTHQTDFELLVGLAARCGLYLSLRGDRLHLLTLEGEGSPLPLLVGENLLEVQVEVNSDRACRTVTASGWDVQQVERRRGKASQARSGRQVSAAASPTLVGGSGDRFLADRSLESDAQAEAAAQAELDHCTAGEVVLRGIADGDFRLRPGARVELKGATSTVNGQYVLTAAAHSLDAQHGYVTELSSEPPIRHADAEAASLALGVVSRLDAAGRVKATLPAHADVETDWMQVASLGAGPGKGLAMLPNVGDQVLLLFTHEDPGQGVVLAGLYGAKGPKDAGVEAGAVQRYTLLTSGGHALCFDDVRKSLKMTDSTGSSIELSPESVRIHSAAPLMIEAPGKPVVISGQSIDFRRK